MSLVQGDCRCGALAFVAGENLSAATGLLVKLSSAGKAVKPGAVSDITPYVVACGAFEGYLCGVVPLSSAANCRVVLKGVCQAGSLLVSAGDGCVEAGALSGSAVPVGIAEETGVEGQRVLLRPLVVGAKGADGGDGADGADGAAGLDGGVLVVPYLDIGGAKPALADSAGLVVWLCESAGGFLWGCGWDVASASAGMVQYVVTGNDGAGNVFLAPMGANTGGTITVNLAFPSRLPASCVKSGVLVGGVYLGAVQNAGGWLELGADAASATFSESGYGCVYLRALVAGDWLTCVHGGAVMFGG